MNHNPTIPIAEDIAPFYDPATLQALIDVYLIAGLSKHNAVLSALADYECSRQPPEQCAA